MIFWAIGFLLLCGGIVVALHFLALWAHTKSRWLHLHPVFLAVLASGFVASLCCARQGEWLAVVAAGCGITFTFLGLGWWDFLQYGNELRRS